MSAFTPAQSAAIAARGNVLVIAGAGTGKTRTLVERCLQLLREGASLDRMLLVTFTEAAAAEMRARLRRALEAELKSAPGLNEPSSLTPALSRWEREQARPASSESARSRPETPDPRPQTFDHFSEQLALLDAAQISTLHGFCLRLVREHFHALAIDPQLVILDERQTRPLARDCLTALLDEHYAGRHPHSEAVQQLIRRAGRGADEHLRVLVGRLHRYAQSLPDPDAWLAGQLAMFREESPSQWRAWLLAGFGEWRAEWLAAFVSAPDVPALKRARAALTALPANLADPAMKALAAALTEILAADSTENWKRKKTELRPPFAKLFEEVEFLHSLVGSDGSATALAEDWAWSRHAMAALVELTRQFTTRFGEAKRQLGGLDFADLEQFALRLLRDDSTGVARHCRDHFRHVCVDEYQDINAVQDAILRAVSGDGTAANRFLVGDLKQSIYRFRLANPRIFASYATAWRGPAGGVIALSDNFRSHEAVLDFVNPLFRALMREAIGGVAYDAEAELRFGNPEGRAALRNPPPPASTEGQGRVGGRESNNPPQPDSTARVELHILTKNADEPAADGDATNDLPDLLAIEREARCVAARLAELRASGHRVWDDDEAVKTFRPVEWRDMVVLMRSPGSRVESFAKEFHRAGVPLHAERGGFYEALEVSDLLNLLRLLDNPLQDLPLLAVLRSPLAALSLEELVAIRAHNEERLFWDALTKFCAAGEPMTQENAAGPPPHPGTPAAHSAFAKATNFLTRYSVWRERLRLGSLTECLERVLAETHYESLLLAEPRGAGRVANVLRLLDLARQFDPYQRQGLHRFLQFIAAQEEMELDHEPAPAPTDNAVRLMSIHQSKGLEFQVVVMAGLGVMFNERDLRGDILLDEEFGLCPMVSPPGAERCYASLPHWLARRRGRRELLGEELRLLYVALTRARDTLLLVGTDSGKEVAEKWRGPAAALSDLALLKARRPLDWLRLWLPNVTNENDWHGDTTGRNALLSWDFYAADDGRLAGGSAPHPITPEGGGEAEVPGASARLEATVAHLRTMLTQPYPHEAATHEPAKTSVTVLRRRAAEADEEAVAWFRPHGGGARRQPGEMSAAQTGLAHHAFLQLVDLTRTVTTLDLRNEAARLVDAGALTERDAAALDFGALLGFWESPVGRQVRGSARAVQREVPFTARFTVRELEGMGLMGTRNAGAAARNTEDEFVIVQGVADLVVFGERDIWLLDYKTDHFGEADLPAKVWEYGPQLQLYARALTRIYGKPVTRVWLHFLASGRTEELPPASEFSR